jgi:DNA-binding response OmpR family regulator
MAHFLVVEDFPPLASILAMAIRREGNRVTRAGTVAAALSFDERFDHAVLDVDLPDGNGVDLALQLLSRGKAQFVTFFTASRDIALLERAASLGYVVDKAAGYDCLIAAVRQQGAQSSGAKRAAVVGTAHSLDVRDSGRSGTRRKVEP